MQKLLDQKKLFPWVATVMKTNKVIGIQAKSDKFDYDLLSRPEDLRLDFDVSLTPLKKYVLPPVEVLVTMNKGKMESVTETEPFVLFGVHPYDVVALRQLDKLFLSTNPDAHYQARRNGALIVAVDVETPSKNVFSGFLGFAYVEDGWDILLTKLNGEYFVEAKTDRGIALIESFSGFHNATEESLRKRRKKWEENEQALRKHTLKPSVKDIGALLEKAYDHKIWKEKARLCFSCGTCNLVCPTCYCFDVHDELDWDPMSAVRERTWDGCMLEAFAVVAGGHNFRDSKEERYRHRYYRKGKYVPDKIGEFSCVGCGRCIGACVSHIAHPVEVYNALMEE
jgi:ferredoxin